MGLFDLFKSKNPLEDVLTTYIALVQINGVKQEKDQRQKN